MDIRRKVAHLDVDDQFRIVYIDLDVGISLVQLAADVLAQLDAGHREALVAALGLDLEALRAEHIVPQIVDGELRYRVLVLFAGGGAAELDDAEHLLQRFKGCVHIRAVLRGLDVHGGLEAIYAELADVCKAASDI